MKKAVYAFGRFQPPTVGHQLVVDVMTKRAKDIGAEAILFTSPTHDGKTNPIAFKDKVKILKDIFKGVKVSEDPSIINPFYAAKWLSNQGYEEVYIVAGGDRAAKYKNGISRYIGHEDPNKAYNFKKFDAILAGDRDPDDEGVAGVSGTELRQHAVDGNIQAFSAGLPRGLTKPQVTKLYKLIRKGVGIKESFGFAKSVSDIISRSIHKLP